MVRDKIKHGDLKITHHKNSLISSYLGGGGGGGRSNATYVDDHNRIPSTPSPPTSNKTIFTITHHNHHPSQQNLTTCTSSNSVSSQASNSSCASTDTKTSRVSGAVGGGDGFSSSLPPPSGANLSVSSSRIHLSNSSRRNTLSTTSTGHAIVKKYSKRSYLNRPLILIPLIVITTLILLALVAFIVYAVISTTRRVESKSATTSQQQQKEQDIGFLVRNVTVTSSSSSSSNPPAAAAAAQRPPPSASLSNSDYDTSKNFYIRPPTYASELCGIQRSPPNLQQTRIVNGYAATQNSWPWTVSMGYFGPRASLPHACGGTLINRRFVITATHCVQEKSIYNLVGNPIAAIEQYSTIEKMLRVYVGVTSRSKDISHATTYRVAKIIMHPNFDASTFKNDLAILQLDQDVMLSDSVGYICVNPETNTLAGTDLFAVGWGFTEKNFFSASDTLNQVRLQIQTQATCGLTYIPVIQFCAGNPSLTKDTCNGDSGGPVMQMNEDKKWRLVGVVSNGDAACTGRGIYTNISFYYDWINANTILT